MEQFGTSDHHGQRAARLRKIYSIVEYVDGCLRKRCFLVRCALEGLGPGFVKLNSSHPYHEFGKRTIVLIYTVKKSQISIASCSTGASL